MLPVVASHSIGEVARVDHNLPVEVEANLALLGVWAVCVCLADGLPLTFVDSLWERLEVGEGRLCVFVFFELFVCAPELECSLFEHLPGS